jgi:RNA polymerase sigma-70 factor (ECF subfamily)
VEQVDDGEAIDLLIRGDRRGPERLLARYQMSVYNLSLRLLGNPADAEDASQEIFLKAFQRIHQYRRGEPFGAWLQGIARHQCIDLLRRRGTALAHLDTAELADTESTALTNIERSSVAAALERLTKRERTLLVLRYWEDQPVEEIARLMGMSEGAAKVALLRARRSVKALLVAREVNSHAL